MADDREEIARTLYEATPMRENVPAKDDNWRVLPWTEVKADFPDRAARAYRESDAILARAQGPGPGEAVAYAINRLEIAVRFLRTTNAASETMVWDDAVCDGRCLADELESCAKALAATPTRESGNQGSSQGCGTGHSGEQLEPAVGATAALAPVPCDGCGATENSKRCMGCLHDFGTPGSAWVHRYAAHPQKWGEG